MKKMINKLKRVVKFATHLCREAVKAVDEVTEVVADKICDGVEVGSWKRTVKIAVPVAALLISGVSAFADAPTFADPSTITTTATTVFTAVATLMVGIVGFWVVLKIVRKISGK
jgi:hypothetical protein